MDAKRRKVDAECRVFQDIWTENYFFIQHFGKPICLVCYGSVAVYKQYNIRRHYESKHPELSELTGDARTIQIQNLKFNLEAQGFVIQKPDPESRGKTRAKYTAFQRPSPETYRNRCASYAVSKLIAENMKSFTDGEFVKDCMMAVVEIVCPERRAAFSKLNLSADTITKRIEEMSADVKISLKDYCKDIEYFSIALIESTDTKDQVAVFVRGVNLCFDIVEEFVQLLPIKGTTTEVDILKSLLNCISDLELDLYKLVCVTTDGSQTMVAEEKGVVALLQSHMENIGINHKVRKVNFIIDQEALCAKSSTLKDVMDIVVRAVNLILSRGLTHPEFKQLLLEAETQYGDIVHFGNICWPCRGALLESLYDLRDEIASFLESHKVDGSEFRDHKWLLSFAFLVDLTSHMNNLSSKLQGRNQMIHEMCDYIHAFDCKLRSWETELQKSNYSHFPVLQETQPKESDIFVTMIHDVRTAFLLHFNDILTQRNDFQLFGIPFHVTPTAVPENVQMELIEMQNCDVLNSKFQADNAALLEFYQKHLPEVGKYENMIDHARKMASVIGSTYLFEQFFSKMKYTKSRLRPQLADGHVEDVLHLSSSSLSPNIEKLSILNSIKSQA